MGLAIQIMGKTVVESGGGILIAGVLDGRPVVCLHAFAKAVPLLPPGTALQFLIAGRKGLEDLLLFRVFGKGDAVLCVHDGGEKNYQIML